MKKKVASMLSLVGILSCAQNTAFAEQWGEIAKLKNFVSQKDTHQTLTNIIAMDAMRLNESALDTEHRPWSDTFWPDVKGSIAYPYAESHFLANPLWWSLNRKFVANRDDLHYRLFFGDVSQDEIDVLSPAEKYDLLVGDKDFSLTRNVVDMVDTRGGVNLLASWSGVCHGWSPASLMLPRPKHSFQVMSPIGRQITFYPADVKGLASFLWGKSAVQASAKVEGYQCQSGARGTKFGRLVDPRCFDVNPAFLHLTTVNQIGLNHRGFIMDRNYKSEVQNQPVWAYRFRYFRVTDRHANPGMSLQDATTPVKDGWDPYRHFRSPNAVSLVGVEATFFYGKENGPNHEATDNTSFDKNLTYTTKYDLELNQAGDIIGGEWREFDDSAAPTLVEQVEYQHPDVIWLVPPGVKAYSVGDFDVKTEWNGSSPVPSGWLPAAIKAASYSTDELIKGANVKMPTPQPLAKVVDTLIDLSRK
ncbi:hypothetical protein WDW37_18270 [Bdellovibrionota bacterium FG-1]